MNILSRTPFKRLKLAKKIITTLAIIFIFESLAFSTPILAAKVEITASEESKNTAEVCDKSGSNAECESVIEEEEALINEDKSLKVKYTKTLKITAYNSLVGQTDSTPCIAARGFNLCKHGVEDSIAANFLPMGTKVRIPEHFGDRIFVVRDRMNARYQNRVDVWMVKKSDALKFGIKNATIEIIE